MDWHNLINYRQFCSCLSDLHFGIRFIHFGVCGLGDYWGNDQG